MSLIPDSVILDRDHLARQTAGDEALERELLGLFEAQCARLRPLLSEPYSSAQRADAAHTLKGSARAIGAWRLASLADLLEEGLRTGQEVAMSGRMAELDAALEATRRALAEREQAGRT